MLKKILPLLILALLMSAYLWQRTNTNHTPLADNTLEAPYLVIDGRIIELELADTTAKRTQGLSDRESLCENCGMLFVFQKKQVQSFWMKNMNFPLDIVWIDEDIIMDISKELPPEGESPQNIYTSNKPVDKVLELNSGYSEKYNLKIGTKITYKLE